MAFEHPKWSLIKSDHIWVFRRCSLYPYRFLGNVSQASRPGSYRFRPQSSAGFSPLYRFLAAGDTFLKNWWPLGEHNMKRCILKSTDDFININVRNRPHCCLPSGRRTGSWGLCLWRDRASQWATGGRAGWGRRAQVASDPNVMLPRACGGDTAISSSKQQFQFLFLIKRFKKIVFWNTAN